MKTNSWLTPGRATMTNQPEGATRRDVVVVPARGASRRFGQPKALAILADDPRAMVRRVVDLYAGTGWDAVLVVTTADLGPAIERLVADAPGVVVVTAPAGGDTARTLAEAWAALASRGEAWTHAWVHPVDMPHVAPATLAVLRDASGRAPRRQVRPAWHGRPGHPVVVPATLAEALAGHAMNSDAPWREIVARAAGAGLVEEPVAVPVDDPGVVLDHDVRPRDDGVAGRTEDR